MSTPPDNPSAFLEVFTDVSDENRGRYHSETYSAGGMSLRDWFAGQALVGMLANPEIITRKADVAAHAYGYADAMLAERPKPSDSSPQ